MSKFKEHYREAQYRPQAAKSLRNRLYSFARIYFATVQRGMTVDETVFATQRPRYLVEEYVEMIEEFGSDEKQVYDRAGIQMAVREDKIEPYRYAAER